jgi:hypothetical protein
VSQEVAVYAPGLRPLSTKPTPDLKYIFGFQAENHGETFAVVLLGIDGKDAKRVTVYDSFLWQQRTVSFNDIAAELRRHNAKGSTRLYGIPIAWDTSAITFAERLRELDCAMIREEDAGLEDEAVARRLVMDMDERMRLKTFDVMPGNTDWLEEHKRFGFVDGQVPLKGFPLMSATRHAFAHMNRAKTAGDKPQPIKYPRRAYV